MTKQASALHQSLMVYTNGEAYIVQGRLDGTKLGRYGGAAEAMQAAIDAAAAAGGGTVAVERGAYELTSAVRLKDRVWLCGSGRGTELRLAAAAADDAAIVCEGIDGAVVSDLTVAGWERTGSGTGILMDDCGDCTVRDVHCIGFAEYGLHMRNHSFLCEVRGCRFADNAMANVYLENMAEGGRGGDFVPNLVSNCIVYGGGKGFDCNFVIVLNIVGCEVFQTNDIAYHIRNSSNSVLISASRSFQVEKEAVVVEDSHEINISSNIFCWHRGHGIVLRRVSWGTVAGNNVIDTGTRGETTKTGVVLERATKGVQVTGNAVFNWGDQPPMRFGITESADCENNNIVSNNINFCTDAALVSEGRGTVAANNVAVADKVYESADKPPYPDFDRKRLEAFVARQKRR